MDCKIYVLSLFIYFGWEALIEEKVIESICTRLPKLRVLVFGWNQECGIYIPSKEFLVPKSIILLKHLRHLAIRFGICSGCKVILPCALAKLLHTQLLDFGGGMISEFAFADLINLRHIFCGDVSFPNIGRLSSLQTVLSFRLENKQGYEIKQLRDLNKLRGSLTINGLENVKSKEEALEANLTSKERLTELSLIWLGCVDDARCSPKVEAEVLEGLCPPVGLETLRISFYSGSRYPDWMVGRLNGGPKYMQNLQLYRWGQLGPGPELEAFPHLRMIEIHCCSWDALPGNMEHLTTLKELSIFSCMNIRWLPTLPWSLDKIKLITCNSELMKACQTEGDPNWHKIKHIPDKYFNPSFTSSTLEEDVASHASEEFQA